MSNVIHVGNVTDAELLARCEVAAAVVLITIDEHNIVRTISRNLDEQDVPRLLAQLARDYSETVR